jgi:hypothetical protein
MSGLLQTKVLITLIKYNVFVLLVADTEVFILTLENDNIYYNQLPNVKLNSKMEE